MKENKKGQKLGFYVDHLNKSIAYLLEEIRKADRKEIKQLQKKGCTLQRTTFEPWGE